MTPKTEARERLADCLAYCDREGYGDGTVIGFAGLLVGHLRALLSKPEGEGPRGYIDPDSDQAMVPTERCLKHGCMRVKLVLKEGHWVCPHCHASYGKDAKEGLTPKPEGEAGVGEDADLIELVHELGKQATDTEWLLASRLSAPSQSNRRLREALSAIKIADDGMSVALCVPSGGFYTWSASPDSVIAPTIAESFRQLARAALTEER